MTGIGSASFCSQRSASSGCNVAATVAAAVIRFERSQARVCEDEPLETGHTYYQQPDGLVARAVLQGKGTACKSLFRLCQLRMEVEEADCTRFNALITDVVSVRPSSHRFTDEAISKASAPRFAAFSFRSSTILSSVQCTG